MARATTVNGSYLSNTVPTLNLWLNRNQSHFSDIEGLGQIESS